MNGKAQTLLLVLVLTLAASCAPKHPADSGYVPVVMETSLPEDKGQPRATENQEKRVLVGLPEPKPRPEPIVNAGRDARPVARETGVPASLDNMLDKATRKPLTKDFQNAETVYDFYPGKQYQVFCAPFHVTQINFGPDERILDVQSGDPRFQVIVSDGLESIDYLTVKPLQEEQLDTNIIVRTAKRKYFIQLVSRLAKANDYQVAVSWRYGDMQTIYKRDPQEVKLMEERAKEEERTRMEAALPKNYGYKWDRKESFSPLTVYDNGKKTYIEFPQSIQILPNFYVKGVGGEQLTNWRSKGPSSSLYEVDLLFDEAVLQIANKKVVIKRDK